MQWHNNLYVETCLCICKQFLNDLVVLFCFFVLGFFSLERSTKMSSVTEKRGHGSSKTFMPHKVRIPTVHNYCLCLHQYASAVYLQKAAFTDALVKHCQITWLLTLCIMNMYVFIKYDYAFLDLFNDFTHPKIAYIQYFLYLIIKTLSL